MSFFQRFKKIDFNKIGSVLGKVATQAGSFAQAYQKGQGGKGSKILSGIGSLNLAQVMDAAVGVKQQIDSMRQTTKSVDIPVQALQVMKQQGFVQPQYVKMTQPQSSGKTLNAIDRVTDFIIDQTQQNLLKIDKLEKQIYKTETRLKQLISLENQFGRGQLLAISAPLVDQLKLLNDQLEVVTNKIVRDENTHQRALNSVGNAVKSVANTPSLNGGVKMYENRYSNEALPRRNVNYIYQEPQTDQFNRNYQNTKDFSRLSGQDYRTRNQGELRLQPGYRPKIKMIRKPPRPQYIYESEIEDDEQTEQDNVYEEDSQEQMSYNNKRSPFFY